MEEGGVLGVVVGGRIRGIMMIDGEGNKREIWKDKTNGNRKGIVEGEGTTRGHEEIFDNNKST